MLRRPRAILLLLLGALVLSSAVAAYRIDGIHWRLAVLRMKGVGELESIPWGELFAMLRPDSEIYLRGLIEEDVPNAYAVVKNPRHGAADVEAGRAVFEAQCSRCHGARGAGGLGPDLAGPLKHGDSDWAIYRTIKDGIPGTAMAPLDLTDTERWQVVGHILAERHDAELEPGGRTLPSVSVSHERIATAGREHGLWPTYSGAYDGQRHSPLSAIHRGSLDRLSLRWVMQTDVDEKIEASPIVVDGAMYVSLPEGVVVSLDPATGETFWRHQAQLSDDLRVCCRRANRGVAVLGDRIYATTLDGRLQCLDARTGGLEWEQRVADPAEGYTITVAPLALRDQVIVGVSGGEFGIRGYVDAYDAGSGERTWRFWTIPGPDEPGGDTWPPDSTRRGGPTWVTGSYDPDLDLLYWGVGHPAPDFDGRQREGDNLYTNSVVALDPATGRLRWHFQFTPHDLWDYDSNHVPVLVDRTLDGEERKLLLFANRSGFFYVLDRTDGEYLGSVPFARQTWALGIDPTGRPIPNPEAVPGPKGTIVWPGASGAANWPPPSYSPATGLFYVLRLNRASVFIRDAAPVEYERAAHWVGGDSSFVPGSSYTAVVAIDPEGPSIAWEAPLPNDNGRGQFSGVLSVPELVFAGEGEAIYALDPRSGDLLWSTRLGGEVGSPPMTYLHDGVQYVAIAAGRNLYAFGVDANRETAVRAGR